MPTADEIRRRAVAAALAAESCLTSADADTARAWVAVTHALIAAADVQEGVEARESTPVIGPPPGYSLR